MKKTTKGLSVVCAAAICFALAASSGCSNRNVGIKGVLSVASFEGGYGSTWTQALADAYKAHNPEAQIEVECNALVRDEAVTALQTGISSVDLFFIDGLSVGKYCEDYGTLADISELYASSPKAGAAEENITIEDKIVPEIVSEMKYAGDREAFLDKYYTVPSPSGPCSLILNVDALNNVFGEGNWEEPRTTDEMMALADAIKEKDAKTTVAGASYTVYPFIYGGTAIEYWRYMVYPWIAQYGGIETWNDMLSVKTNGTYDQAAYQPAAKEVAYAQLEQIIKRSNGYCDPTSMGNKFSASQKYFFQGRACMYVTGDWLEKDMESSSNQAELKMIRTPVISALSEKIESELNVSFGTTAEEKDEKLSEIVAAVDAGNSSVEGVSEQVFARVKEARSYVFTLANSAVGFVPQSSVNKDIAIDFLRFMYSDEGVAIVLRESKGYIPVVNASSIVADGEATSFRSSVNAISISGGNSVYMYTSDKDPIRYRAGLDVYLGNEKPEVAMGKKTGALTAAEFLAKEAKLLAEKWSDYMKVV